MATAATATPAQAANPDPTAEAIAAAAAVVPEKSFDDAFAEFMKPDGTDTAATTAGPNAAADAPADPPEGETPEAKAAREAAAAAGDPPTEIVDPADPAHTPTPPTPSPQQTDPIRQLAELLAANQRQPEPAPQPQPQPQPQLYSPEETEQLKTYFNDYGDVAKAESLVRRGEYARLTAHIFKQVGDYFAPQMAVLQQIAARVNYQQLTTDNPNYPTERAAIEGWIATQPDYLQQAYMGVMQRGTTDQVKSLFDRFRAETGTSTAADTGGTGIAPQPNAGGKLPASTPAAPELSPQAKQAAQRLAPVGGKRSAVTQAEPTTFDDAFDTFAKAMAKT